MEITGCFLLLVITFFYTNQVEAQGRGSVRLFNNGNTSPNNTAGIVEVYYNNQWGTICSSIYNDDTATVVCHQLGYSGGLGYESNGNYGSVTSQPAIDDVVCSTSNLVILQCVYDDSNPSCSGNDFLAVQCYSTPIWNSPYSGMLRLQNGPYAGVGHAEIYCNGQWGAICDDSWFDNYAASTVCTQLGYNNAEENSAVSYSGTVWLRQVDCAETYSCLSDCVGGSCPTSSVRCSEDVAYVTCSYSLYGGIGSNQYTCYFNNIFSGFSDAVIASIVIASFVVFACCVLIIALPFCICCCLGVGIGAVAGSAGTSTYSNL